MDHGGDEGKDQQERQQITERACPGQVHRDGDEHKPHHGGQLPSGHGKQGHREAVAGVPGQRLYHFSH